MDFHGCCMMLHDVAIFIKRHEGWTGMKNDPSMLQISLNKSLWRLSVTATHLAHVCWGKDGEASQKKDTVSISEDPQSTNINIP